MLGFGDVNNARLTAFKAREVKAQVRDKRNFNAKAHASAPRAHRHAAVHSHVLAGDVLAGC